MDWKHSVNVADAIFVIRPKYDLLWNPVLNIFQDFVYAIIGF